MSDTINVTLSVSPVSIDVAMGGIPGAVGATGPQGPAGSGGGGGGATNLTTTLSSTSVIVNSDTGTDATIPAADTTNAGVMTKAMFDKLGGIATGATANSSDAILLARANHTGQQLASTISDFSTAADARISAAAGVSIATLSGGKIPSSQIPSVGLVTVQSAASQAAQLALTTQEGDVVVRTDTSVTYMRNSGTAGTMADFTLLNTPSDTVTSVNGFIGVVVLAKADVGLGNVDNTSDATKNSAVAALTNKDLTSGTNTFPTFNQNTSGTAANLSGTPALPNGVTATTQAAADNSTKLATTAYTDSAITAERTATRTLTGARVTARTNSVASSATPTINTDTTDEFDITALAAAVTSFTTNLSGTPVNGDRLVIRIKDNGVARAITWGASFVSSGVAALLTTTVINKTHFSLFRWDSTAAKWVCMAVDAVGY
jgi:hypothetical protein